MPKTCREQVEDKSARDDLDFRERVLKDAIRDRASRPTAFWEWVDQIEALAKNFDAHAASEKPYGIFDGRVYLSAWPALQAKFRIAACAYRELLDAPDVKEAMGVWQPVK
jgi:hypothetical protein